jgi:hypothetical protein
LNSITEDAEAAIDADILTRDLFVESFDGIFNFARKHIEEKEKNHEAYAIGL